MINKFRYKKPSNKDNVKDNQCEKVSDNDNDTLKRIKLVDSEFKDSDTLKRISRMNDIRVDNDTLKRINRINEDNANDKTDCGGVLDERTKKQLHVSCCSCF